MIKAYTHFHSTLEVRVRDGPIDGTTDDEENRSTTRRHRCLQWGEDPSLGQKRKLGKVEFTLTLSILFSLLSLSRSLSLSLSPKEESWVSAEEILKSLLRDS